ncbi:hypothetical protein [Halobacterium litoreum]|uniref:Uncharacterized protein n=1 Tax=Halobacterium litoreum TaxID=2039234 RepID=A0ABD5NC36_9EURY|nr:hypothetical protein [Halobacterium litoreum]UHH14375.1 hypothetical protein LT972_05085 [Halobacterium litoreum]
MTLARVLAARRLELFAVALASAGAFVAEGPSAVPVAAVVGFFAAKSAESLRRAAA